jgi:acetoin utilization protein AcuB
VIAKELISDSIAPVKPGETCIQALGWMDEFRVAHLPVVDGSEYIGLLSEEDIYSGSRFEQVVDAQQLMHAKPYIGQDSHIFEAFRIFAEHKLSLLPVLSEKNQYLGVITLEGLVMKFASASSIQNPGAVIVLERSYKDFSISEIAQIVESNDATILSMFITSVPESSLMEISMKVSRMEPGPILQTFTRYNYTIKATYSEGAYHDDLKGRYDQLMAYLNI